MCETRWENVARGRQAAIGVEGGTRRGRNREEERGGRREKERKITGDGRADAISGRRTRRSRARGSRAIAMRRRAPVQSVIIITLPPARSVLWTYIYTRAGEERRKRRDLKAEAEANQNAERAAGAEWRDGEMRSCSPRQMFTPRYQPRGDCPPSRALSPTPAARERQWAAGNWRNWM